MSEHSRAFSNAGTSADVKGRGSPLRGEHGAEEEADEDQLHGEANTIAEVRTILVDGEVGTEMARAIVAQLIMLENESDEDIKMIINSPGGSMTDCMAIIDAMRNSKCNITTVGTGQMASAASVMLFVGDEVLVTEHATGLIHQVSFEAGGQYTDMASLTSSMGQHWEMLKDIYVEYTGLNHKYWDVICERDTALTAAQMLEMGLVDDIFKGEKPRGKYAAEARRKPQGLQAAMDKTFDSYIARMSADEIVKEINNGSGKGGVFAGLRGKLAVRLAQFPEYQTEGRQRELAATAPAAGISRVVSFGRHWPLRR